MAYAAHQADLDAPRSDGSSERQHLAAIVAKGPRDRGYAKAVERLDGGPSMPDALAYVWHWYLELRGAEHITHGDIRDWADLTDRRPEPFEVQAIRALDATVRNVMHAKTSKTKPPATPDDVRQDMRARKRSRG